MAKKKAQKAGKSFEDNLCRLEEIVESLENGSLSLDKSIEIYSEGADLIGACRKSLAEAEQKIQKLTKGASGQLSTKPFEAEDIREGESGEAEE
jgi:exodeoxyribonuclease VII small subunit